MSCATALLESLEKDASVEESDNRYVIRIYLDHNKWIELARVDHGRASSAEKSDVLVLAREARKRNLASFPLSDMHYMETLQKRDVEARKRLAETMASISQYDAIAPVWQLVPMEIDGALKARFGRPITPRSIRVFAKGAAHALADARFDEAKSYQPPGKPALGSRGRALFVEKMEFSALSGEEIGDGPKARTPFEDGSSDYYEREKALVDWFRAAGASAEQRRMKLAQHTLEDIGAQIVEALDRAGIAMEEFLGLGAEGMLDFLLSLPSRHVEHVLRTLRHENSQHVWKANDLADLGALCSSIPYCDVVVTERHWTHIVKRAGLDVQYGTNVISSLEDLRTILIGL